MSKIIVNASFYLNDESLLEDWKKMSAVIDEDLVGVDGFISRDSAIGEDKKVYCILKWDSLTQQEAFMKSFEEREDSAELMAEFGRIVNMETMTRELLDVL